VKWNNALGDLFPVLCGVRQGCVLSPVLFVLYIDGLYQNWNYPVMVYILALYL